MVNVEGEGERTLGRDAQRNNILAARVISETVKTTLGPRGMDKMLVDRVGNVVVTNDGVTILEEMDIEHPAAKMVVDVAKTQEKEVGDGTTTAVMLAGKLLENAERLLDQKIHPTIIVRGFRLAERRAQELLGEISIEMANREELVKVARTAMTGKGVEYLRNKFAEILVDAVDRVAEDSDFDLGDVRIEKMKGGSVEDSELIDGVVLDHERVSKEMPKRVDDARIVLIDEALEVRSPDMEAKISVSSPEQLSSFLGREDEILKEKVEQVKSVGANVVFAQKGVDDLVQHYLAKAGIYVVRRIPRSDMQSLARATGGRLVSKLSEISADDLGYAKCVEERRDGENGMTFVLGCSKAKSVTILVRGGTDHVVDEVERAIEDAIGDVRSALRGKKVVAGGGAIEIELARRLREFAKGLIGRERLAVEEFGSALEFVPTTLAENAGLDPIDVMTELRSEHDRGNVNVGLNLVSLGRGNGYVQDNLVGGVLEPLGVKTQAIASAVEVAIMILRIDDVVAARQSGGGEGKKGKVGGMMGYD
jgi:archaeal chaperonin